MSLLIHFFLCIEYSGLLIFTFWKMEILKEYQTLLTGILALAAALFSVWALWQIEDKKRKDKNRVARAMLVHSLSDICQYAKDTLEYLYNYRNADTVQRQSMSAPTIPTESIFPQLCNAIEFADPLNDVGNYLAQLVCDLQIHNSRLRDSNLEQTWRVTLEVAAVELHATAENVFDYARGKSNDCLEIKGENIHRATRTITAHALNLFPFELHFPEAQEKIMRRYPPSIPSN
ncbi:MAG: hypothetical protein EBR02_08665 [Alphaproteobacteria bacterium]|nr:hypothetical protein [Alphaproteobacteria bacterium]